MHGILIIDKPKGYTSQDVVSKVKKILNIKKAGHTGTLDPLATGVLPVMIGDYTKLSKYLIEHDKTYIEKIKLGEKSSTGDLEGEVIERKNVENDLSTEKIINVLNSFLGKQKQKPPMYSAIKINGKKLYEYARNNETIVVPERDIEIYNINFINFENNEIEFEVSCSKGTYIRSLCEDIAEKLNTVGLMSSLIRTRVDRFDIKNSITLDELEELKNKNDIESKLIKMEDIFSNLSKINLDRRKINLFLNGVMLTFVNSDGIYNIYDYNNNYLGTGTIKNNLLKRDIIINETI